MNKQGPQSFGSHPVTWRDIYGLKDVKNEFQEVIHVSFFDTP